MRYRSAAPVAAMIGLCWISKRLWAKLRVAINSHLLALNEITKAHAFYRNQI